MAPNDQNRNDDSPDTSVLGDINPTTTDSDSRPGSRRPGAGGTATNEEDVESGSGLGRRDADRGLDNPQRNPRTGPIG